MKNVNKIKISPDEIYGVGQDKKSWFPAWNVLDDKSLYQKVRQLAHSTFDLSKFTVVGSPNITADGIVSGFTPQGSRLEVYNLDFSNMETFSFEIDLYSSVSYTGLDQQIYSFRTSDDAAKITINCPSNSIGARPAIKIYYPNSASTTTSSAWYYFEKNTSYKLKCIYDGTQLKFYLNNNYLSGATFLVDKTWLQDITQLRIGNSGNDSSNYNLYWTGKFNLKEISLITNGVPVFNGNKTGIDTIKPNTYTTPTNKSLPTISDDGIASGFDDDHVIDATVSATTYSSSEHVIKYKGRVKIGSSGSKIIFSYYTTRLEASTGSIAFRDSTNTYIVGATLNGLSVGDWIDYELVIDNTNGHTIKAWKDEVLVGSSTSSTTASVNLSSYWIGKYMQANNYYWEGSIDLNAFRIYVDDNLICQLCLKIPYTEAKLNHKFVDAAYRNRIIDLLNQFGYNGYHTIDEDNENFTLPTHDFDDVIDCYEGESGSWEQTVGQVVKQQGLAAETGVEVTLMKPYKDEDSYALSIPYTSKTASSFVPAADGDWFAKGKVVL